MDDVLTCLVTQHAVLGELVDHCSDEDWGRVTRCDGWDVAAVLLHLAQTDELAVASVRGDLDGLRHGFIGPPGEQKVSVDDAAAARVDADRAAGGPAIRQRWHDASQALLVSLQSADPHKRVTWVAGRLSARTLAATRLAECWIHASDIASALGTELQPDDGLRFIARLAWRTLPYAFDRANVAMSGPVALDLTGPRGDRWLFEPEGPAVTTLRGSAAEFCEVAARRVEPNKTRLVGEGPDAAEVLRLVRTYAL